MAARLTKTQARRVLELDDAAEVTRDAVRAAFRKLALRVHPDKNPGDAAAEERFREVTLACAVLVAEAEAEEGGGAAAGVARDFDYDEWNAAYQTPQLAQILKLAVSGMDPHEIESLLRMRGQHRPPENFGMAPYPSFDSKATPVGAGASAVQVRDTPEQEARRRAKAAAAIAALGSDDSDAEQLEGPPVDMHGLFARIHAEEGLDEDGNALSDSGGEYDG